MTQETFLKEVIKEIHAIKFHATPDELNKLDFNKFTHSYSDHCVYGLLTGSCFSERASEIFNKVFNLIYSEDFRDFLESEEFNKDTSLNGFTYLEVYLYHSNSNYHKHIIDFLQSKVKKLKTLKLKDNE